MITSDPLSEVLDIIRLRSAFFFVWEPLLPYSIGVPNGEKFKHLVLPGSDQVISYHIVIDGPCWGNVEGEPPIRLESGDILLLPHGDAYVIGDKPREPAKEDEAPSIVFFKALAAGELPPVIVNGGDGPEKNKLICGFFGCDMKPFNPLLSTLPRMLRIPLSQQSTDPLAGLISFVLKESGKTDQGSRCVMARLSEVMFIEVLRRYLTTEASEQSGWLGGLKDPLTGAALNCLHNRLAHPWTLEMLAQEIGTSRSTLAERFTKVIGIPPMQYLTQWRMQVAARRLADGAPKNYDVAQEIGYESEAAFIRAFTRVVGQTPSKWRDRFLNDPDQIENVSVD